MNPGLLFLLCVVGPAVLMLIVAIVVGAMSGPLWVTTSRFEHMQRIATVMAESSLVPDALCMTEDPASKQMVYLPPKQVFANCFLVVNQAVRWGLDPFAVAQCVSVVHGKLCYEGKLVSAVIEAKLDIRLHHHFVGDPKTEDYRIYLCDRPFNTKVKVIRDGKEIEVELREVLEPGIKFPGFRVFDGSVGEWKTSGNNSPWSPKNYGRMLIYRGTRDWTRIYEPAVMLGVYTQDEMIDLAENARALRARDVTGKPTLAERLQAANQSGVETALLRAAEVVEEEETSANENAAPLAEQNQTREGGGKSLHADPATNQSSEPASTPTSQAQTGGEQPVSARPAQGASTVDAPAASALTSSADAAPNSGASRSSVGAGDKPPAGTQPSEPKPAGGDEHRETRTLNRDEAYRLGREARAKGQTKRSCPKIIRDVDELMEAWLEGYDEAPTDD